MQIPKDDRRRKVEEDYFPTQFMSQWQRKTLQKSQTNCLYKQIQKPLTKYQDTEFSHI